MEGKNDRLHFGGALVCPGVVCGWTGERSTADNTLSPSFFLFYFSFWPVPAAWNGHTCDQHMEHEGIRGGWNHLVAIDSLSLYTFRLRFICPRWMGWMDVQVSLSLSWHHHQLYEGYNDWEKFINIRIHEKKDIWEPGEEEKKKKFLNFPKKFVEKWGGAKHLLRGWWWWWISDRRGHM